MVENDTQMDADRTIASPRVVAWRARRVVAFLVVLSIALIALTIVARQADPNAIDVGATRWIQQFQNPAFATLMTWVSWVGFAPQAWVMPFVIAAPFVARGLWVEALWILATQATSILVNGFKDVVHRPRPSPELVGVLFSLDSPSFPSGHTVQYTILFGFTFFLVYVLARRSMLRTVGLVLLAVPIVLVGPSRLYLGQHWLSDVLGGYSVAALLLVLLCWAYTRGRSPAPGRDVLYPRASHSP